MQVKFALLCSILINENLIKDIICTAWTRNSSSFQYILTDRIISILSNLENLLIQHLKSTISQSVKNHSLITKWLSPDYQPCLIIIPGLKISIYGAIIQQLITRAVPLLLKQLIAEWMEWMKIPEQKYLSYQGLGLYPRSTSFFQLPTKAAPLALYITEGCSCCYNKKSQDILHTLWHTLTVW